MAEMRPSWEGTPDKVTNRDRWGHTPWEAAQELLREQGITEFVVFQEIPEGDYLPSGPDGAWVERVSWSVMTPDGGIRDVWLGWDKDKTAPDGSKGNYTLSFMPLWSQESHEGHHTDYDYLRARKELGLPLTEEQERILQKWVEENP